MWESDMGQEKNYVLLLHAWTFHRSPYFSACAWTPMACALLALGVVKKRFVLQVPFLLMGRLEQERLLLWRVSGLYQNSGESFPIPLLMYLDTLQKLKEIQGKIIRFISSHSYPASINSTSEGLSWTRLKFHLVLGLGFWLWKIRCWWENTSRAWGQQKFSHWKLEGTAGASI